MKIAIAIVLVLAAYAFAATYTLSSISGSSIKMTVNAPSATTTSHNLTMVSTWASAYTQTTAQWLNVVCATATDSNYTLPTTSVAGFAYEIACTEATTGAGCTSSVGTLAEGFFTSAVTWTSDTSIKVTTATAATVVAGTPVKTTTTFTDTTTIASAIPALPLANATAATYHVCWSSMDTAVDVGTGSTTALTVANRYNVTFSSAFNSLSLTGLAIASAAIVSLF